MKQLIVNADDFGYTRGVNQGILRCYEQGIVRSTTIMANGQAFDAAVEIARAHPELGVGVHIVLVGEPAVAPRAKLPLLTDFSGQLPRTIRSLILKSRSSAAFSQEIETEMRAQIDRVRAAGIQPTHLDTHKHTHIYPPVMKVLAKVAQDYGITRVRMPFEDLRGVVRRLGGVRVALSGRSAFVLASHGNRPYFRRHLRRSRLRTPDHFFGFFATGQLARDALLGILRSLPEGTSELVCHPGFVDADLQDSATRLKEHRAIELAALTDPAVRKEIAILGIRLMSYQELN